MLFILKTTEKEHVSLKKVSPCTAMRVLIKLTMAFGGNILWGRYGKKIKKKIA